MKKSEREAVFNKFDGKCAYCGCGLEKGWHVDHKEPIGRRWKYVDGHAIIDGKKQLLSRREIGIIQREQPDVEVTFYTAYKTIPYGCDFPERDCFDNYMPACASCNILKSSLGLEGFRDTIANFINSLNSYTNQYKFAKRYGLVVETGNNVEFHFETLTTNK